MIWHIFKKDFRLLLPLAAVTALLQWVSAALVIRVGPFFEPRELQTLAAFMPVVALLALAALIAAVIHQDAIPGTSQDWLTRPIRRRDLLLAKLLFILLVGHGPLFVANLAEGLGDRFSVTASASAALANGVAKFLLISLPVAALAAVTRGLGQLVAGGAALILACTVPMILAPQFGIGAPEISGSGVGWIRPILIGALLALAAGIILTRQYLRRATVSSQLMTIGAAAIATLVWMSLPWTASFAIQRALAPERGAADPIALRYEPATIGKQQTQWGFAAYGGFGAEPSVPVFVPLRITGVPADSTLHIDHVDVRVIAANGATRYRGASRYFAPSGLRLGNTPVAASVGQVPVDGELRITHPLSIPEAVYAAIRNESAQIEIDYSLTLLRVNAMSTMPAVGGTASLPGPINCSSRTETDRSGAEIGCLTPRTMTCFDTFLRHVPTGVRNPALQQCNPDYAPYNVTLAPVLMNRVRTGVPYEGFAEARYPLADRKLSELQLVIRTYTPRDHFTRRLVIPAARLAGRPDASRVAPWSPR